MFSVFQCTEKITLMKKYNSLPNLCLWYCSGLLWLSKVTSNFQMQALFFFRVLFSFLDGLWYILCFNAHCLTVQEHTHTWDWLNIYFVCILVLGFLVYNAMCKIFSVLVSVQSCFSVFSYFQLHSSFEGGDSSKTNSFIILIPSSVSVQRHYACHLYAIFLPEILFFLSKAVAIEPKPKGHKFDFCSLCPSNKVMNQRSHFIAWLKKNSLLFNTIKLENM